METEWEATLNTPHVYRVWMLHSLSSSTNQAANWLATSEANQLVYFVGDCVPP